MSKKKEEKKYVVIGLIIDYVGWTITGKDGFNKIQI
jgi:hypothetical protein